MLREYGADIDKADNDGRTPCYIAAYNGHVDVIRLLHEYGADIEKADNDGRTPCFAAAFNGHVDVIRLLHEYGADIEKANNDGETPLQIARERNKAEVVAFLENPPPLPKKKQFPEDVHEILRNKYKEKRQQVFHAFQQTNLADMRSFKETKPELFHDVLSSHLAEWLSIASTQPENTQFYQFVIENLPSHLQIDQV
jgi:hypothetical protein